MRKLVGGDEDSLMGKAKSMHTSKAEEGMNSPPPMGREMPSCPQEGWALSHLRVAWQEKHCHSEHPHFLPHPAVLGDPDILWCGTVSLGTQCWESNLIPFGANSCLCRVFND